MRYTATNGHLEVFKWWASTERGEHRVFCTVQGANWAAGNGHLHILQWLSSEERGEHRVFCTIYTNK